MKDKNYKIKINNIYIGEIIKVNKFNKINNKIVPEEYKRIRNILFTINKNKYGDDLLTKSNNIEILNYTKNINYNNTYFINNIVCLKDLLKYLDYKDKLTYNDILNIKEYIFSYDFLKNNSEIFGYEYMNYKEFSIYNSNKLVTNLLELKYYLLKLNILLKEKYVKRPNYLQSSTFYVPLDKNINIVAVKSIEGLNGPFIDDLIMNRLIEAKDLDFNHKYIKKLSRR